MKFPSVSVVGIGDRRMVATRFRARFVRRHLQSRRRGKEICDGTSGPAGGDPLSSWREHVEAVNTLLEVVEDLSGRLLWTEPLAEAIAALLGGTGCAVLRREPGAESGGTLVASGTWENNELSYLLQSEGCGWMLPFADDVSFAVRRNRRPVPRPAQARRVPKGTAVAVPLGRGPEQLGVLLITYEVPRSFPRDDVMSVRLVGGYVALLLAGERLRARTRQLAERNTRLMSDIERMGILLRRRHPPDASGR
jgi:GAF domain-containing protein